MSQKVSVREAAEQVKNGAFLLDVRGFDEFATGHALPAVCIPLPDLERRVGEVPTNQTVLVMCQSGGRSDIAAARLRALGMDSITDVAGGFQAWRQAGLPTVKQSSVVPLERQVRIAAGVLVFGFSSAALLVNFRYIYGAVFVGFMLALTGMLGICPMMSALKLMPWNRTA